VTKGFTVILLIDEPLASAALISQALAAARKVPLIDVAREVRSCWGLIGENRSEEESKNVVAALKERGIASTMAPTENLPVLAGLQIGRKIEIEDGGFRCKMSRGMTPLIPWSAPSFLAAAILKTSSFKNVTKQEGPSKSEKLVRMSITMATGIPIPGGRTRSVTTRKETTAVIGVIDIGMSTPAGRIRMEADRLDLSYLGDRRTYDSLGNFKLMIADAASRMAAENINKGARMILAKENVANMGYDNVGELEREERWMMARRALR
jgi:hypothetical protein